MLLLKARPVSNNNNNNHNIKNVLALWRKGKGKSKEGTSNLIGFTRTSSLKNPITNINSFRVILNGTILHTLELTRKRATGGFHFLLLPYITRYKLPPELFNFYLKPCGCVFIV